MGDQITILGSGPAAFFAASACENHQVDWRMIGREIPRTFGPIFFYRSLMAGQKPDLIDMTLVGSRAVYAEKTGSSGRLTSADFFGLGGKATYLAAFSPHEQMHSFYFHHRMRIEFRNLVVGEAEELTRRGNVINTLPHPFLQVFPVPIYHWPTLELANRDFSPFIKYDGFREVPWVRWGCMWDHTFLELPSRMAGDAGLLESSLQAFLQHKGIAPLQTAFSPGRDLVHNPLTWDERCGQRSIRVGRFSEMNRRKLAHHAYDDVWDWLNQREV